MTAKTAKTAKIINYTPEQTAEVVKAYTENPTSATVDMLAEKLGKTTKSIIAKLSREKVYKAKAYVTKTGEPVKHKDELADYIAEALGLNENDADSLTKVNKTALKIIAEFIEAEKTPAAEADNDELDYLDIQE